MVKEDVFSDCKLIFFMQLVEYVRWTNCTSV